MRLAAILVLLALPVQAELALPLPTGAVETGRKVEEGRYELPTGTFSADSQPALVLQGIIETRAWRTPPEQASTGAVIRALRQALDQAGYDPIFECDGDSCGGFDFRFHLPVLLPPQMEVDLNNFRYIAAVARDMPDHHLSLLVSRSDRGGHIQLAEITPADPPVVPLELPAVTTPQGGDIATQFAQTGRAVLEDIAFESGSTALVAGSADNLAPVVALLEAQPDLVLLIVGHSDNEGGLDANIRLSRERAGAVRDALIANYGISPDRLVAEGAGYLSPRALNDTEEGRASNRRVEIVKR